MGSRKQNEAAGAKCVVYTMRISKNKLNFMDKQETESQDKLIKTLQILYKVGFVLISSVIPILMFFFAGHAMTSLDKFVQFWLVFMFGYFLCLSLAFIKKNNKVLMFLPLYFVLGMAIFFFFGFVG